MHNTSENAKVSHNCANCSLTLASIIYRLGTRNEHDLNTIHAIAICCLKNEVNHHDSNFSLNPEELWPPKITMWNKEDQIDLQGYLEPGIITAIDFDL